MNRVRTAALAILPLIAWSIDADATVIYVDASATGSGDGSSWINAYPRLADALPTASAGDEVRVAAGIYRPTDTPGDRAATFTVPDGVHLLGGYAPGGSAEADWRTHLTILSGDIEGDDLDLDGDGTGYAETDDEIVGLNSLHVVTTSGTSPDTQLAGFIITAGSSFDLTCDFTPDPPCAGAGILNEGGSPALLDLFFSANVGAHGGGIANFSASPTIARSRFEGNVGAYGGGGIANVASHPNISLTSFVRNSGAGGGGVANWASDPQVVDSDFVENIARSGGAIRNVDSSPSIQRVLFRGNGNCCSGILSGDGGAVQNLNSSPEFVDVDFVDNTVDFAGAAVYNGANSSPTMNRVRFVENVAGLYQSVVHSEGGSSLRVHNGTFFNNAGVPLVNLNAGVVEVTNATFYANRWGAIRSSDSELRLVNASFAGNFLSAATHCSAVNLMSANGALSIKNSVVWHENPDSPQPFCASDAGQIEIGHSLIQGCNPAGAWNSLCGNDLGGNVPDSDPLFTETPEIDEFPAASGDLHLDPASPARDAGDNTANPLPVDLDGNARIVGAAIDLGAFEWRLLPDIFNDGFEATAP
ncbi:MAG: hypothetical protein KDJ14_01320 [Xanthomonadales bacterium]|nr:hypothetical protein [Xanthomonadales bacterium]